MIKSYWQFSTQLLVAVIKQHQPPSTILNSLKDYQLSSSSSSSNYNHRTIFNHQPLTVIDQDQPSLAITKHRPLTIMNQNGRRAIGDNLVACRWKMAQHCWAAPRTDPLRRRIRCHFMVRKPSPKWGNLMIHVCWINARCLGFRFKKCLTCGFFHTC